MSVDIAAVREALAADVLCNTCTGWSPSWDGHNPPRKQGSRTIPGCRGWAQEQQMLALEELEQARAEIAELRAVV